MAIINQANRELQVKIVYYGPALGGKTTKESAENHQMRHFPAACSLLTRSYQPKLIASWAVNP